MSQITGSSLGPYLSSVYLGGISTSKILQKSLIILDFVGSKDAFFNAELRKFEKVPIS